MQIFSQKRWLKGTLSDHYGRSLCQLATQPGIILMQTIMVLMIRHFVYPSGPDSLESGYMGKIIDYISKRYEISKHSM